MKIAMVFAEDTPEWRNAHVTDLSTALTALGHEVSAHRLDGAQADQELHLGDFVEVLRADWNSSRPDLVHAHFWRPGLAASLAARTSGLPVVQSFHGFGRRADVERLVSREAALVLASCEHEMFDLAGAGISRARIAVVARGVDTDLFQSHGEVADRGPMRRIVTAVDPLSDNGAADLVAALPRLPDVELVIAGAHAPAEPTGCGAGHVSSAWRNASGCWARSHGGRCPRCCGRRTWWRTCRGYRRGTRCRWKRWRAASRWSRPPSEGSPMP